MSFYYYDKQQLKKHKLYLLGIEDKKLTDEEIKQQHKESLYVDYVVYESNAAFFGYPIYDETLDILRQPTDKELIDAGLKYLSEGEYLDGDNIKYVMYNPQLGYVTPKFNKQTHVWEESATETEINEYIGKLVTNLLFTTLELGFDIEVLGKSHKQSLSDSKRKALNEQITAINLATELGETIQYIPWPFKDDGTDTVIIPVEEFKKLVLESHKYGQDCYIAAEYLKDRKSTTVTMQDFLDELKKVREKRVNKA